MILIGNATRDTELRHTSTGKAVANIRLATNRLVNGAEQTQFHTVVCWDTLAETVSRYAKKGDPLYVEGRLEYRSFQDEEGKARGTVEIVVSDVQFLGRRRDKVITNDDAVPAAPVPDAPPDDGPF